MTGRIDWTEAIPSDCPPAVAADLRTAAVAAISGGLAARGFYRRADLGITDKGRDNPVTDEGATLGRVLFYDKRLSFNNRISCGSCPVRSSSRTRPSTRGA